MAQTDKPQREPYVPDRARQLLITLWVVVGLGALLAALGAWWLVAGAPVGLVVLLLLVPAVAMLTLAGWSRGLLRRGDGGARVAVPVTAAVTTLVGLLWSRSGPGVLIAVVGILLLLLALLPGRDDEDASSGRPPSDR